MNKIERAIYDTKLRLKKKEEDRMILNAEINCLKEQLDTLEIIEGDKLTPHQTETKETEK
jgi:hypothetical protein